MKVLFALLLCAALALGAWLYVEGPSSTHREPARLALQIDAARVRPLSDADLARLRSQAEHAAALAAATAAPAPAPTASAAELPSPACLDVGGFASEAAARKLRTRLGGLGLADKISGSGADAGTRLRISGLDGPAQVQVHALLREYPKLEATHCVDTGTAH